MLRVINNFLFHLLIPLANIEGLVIVCDILFFYSYLGDKLDGLKWLFQNSKSKS